MSMLAGLLPGLREFRAPLAAGYLWLAAAWIQFSADVPNKENAGPLVAAGYRLRDVASAFGLAAVISFSAYIVGILSVAVSGGLASRVQSSLTRRSRLDFEGWLVRLLNRSWDDDAKEPPKAELWRAWIKAVYGDNPSRVVMERMWKRVPVLALAGGITPHGKTLAEPPPLEREEVGKFLDVVVNVNTNDVVAEINYLVDRPDLPGSVVSAVRTRVMAERDRITVRLLGIDSDLFQAIDRTEAEGEFRFAIAVASIPVTLAIARAQSATLLALAILLAGVCLIATTLFVVVRRRLDAVMFSPRRWLDLDGVEILYLIGLWLAILLPIPVAAVLSVSLTSSPTAAVVCAMIGVLLSLVLWERGVSSVRRSNAYLVDALILDRVRAPALEPIQALIPSRGRRDASDSSNRS